MLKTQHRSWDVVNDQHIFDLQMGREYRSDVYGITHRS